MKKSSPVDNCYTYIKNQIISKSIFPGTRLIEQDLTEKLGISRISIRTALAKLQYEGLIDIVPNKGSFVVNPSYDDIIKIYDVRLNLELGVLKTAIKIIGNDAIEKMEKSYENQVKLKEKFNIAEYAILNREFHEELVKATNSSYYQKFLNEIYNKVFIYMIFYDDSVDNTNSLISHRAILDSVKSKNLDAGIKAILRDNEIGVNDINPSNLNIRVNI